MFYIVLGTIIGISLPMQTAINSQLRICVKSPFIASSISFLVGTLFLLLTCLIMGINIMIPAQLFSTTPWWVWIGGVLGATWVTANIFLFQKLGSIQATIMPLFGQVIMSMIIDNFGWLNSIQLPFNLTRLLGIILVIAGILLAILFKKSNNEEKVQQKNKTIWFWRFFGIFMGMIIAVQGTINGQLGIVLQSPVHAAFISFLSGTIFLIIVAFLKEKSFKNALEPIKQKAPAWIWLGGCIGAIYVIVIVILVSNLGIGQAIVIGLFGQIVGSTLIEHFGLIKSPQHKVKLIQIIGLAIMFVGVLIIKIL